MRLQPLSLLVLIAFTFVGGLADLPVHCLRHQVSGDWEFVLGPTSPKRSSCGHRRPDNPDMQPALDFVANMGTSAIMQVSLEEPMTASTPDGAEGTWTMIYDEAFEVAIKDRVFLAFSNFEWVEDAEKGKTNVSHCDSTQIGWYHNQARTEWGCYLGRKLTSDPDGSDGGDDSPTANTDTSGSLRKIGRRAGLLVTADSFGSQVFLGADGGAAATPADEAAAPAPAPPSAEPDVVLPGQLPVSYKPWIPESAGYDSPMPSHWQHSVADALNFLQLGWSAASYDLFRGKTPRELNNFAGVKRHRLHGNVSRASAAAATTAPTLLSIASRIRRALGGSRGDDEDGIDWRNKDGKNWLAPVVNQGDCGSCYTISTVHMLTARHRIKSQDPSRPAFSVTFPLYCSEYNQGCDGGYGFLQSKWSEDVGLIPEHCSPFSANAEPCRALKGCDLGASRFRAAGHRYVGGYYGGSEEHFIREELVASGPAVMSFEPREDFMYYKGGVYRSVAGKIHQEWEQVDHAVLLVGYGTDAGKKYWTMQNSWGDDWGEGGYFRMVRGRDESGCESIVVAADVIEETSNVILDDFLAALSQN